MNVLFWNINRNVTEGKEKIERYIINCVAENDVDIAVFAEYKDKNGSVINIDCAAIERGLGNMFTWIKGIEPDGAVILLARKSIGKVCKIQQDIDSRYSLYVVDTALKKYLLAAVHLEDAIAEKVNQEVVIVVSDGGASMIPQVFSAVRQKDATKDVLVVVDSDGDEDGVRQLIENNIGHDGYELVIINNTFSQILFCITFNFFEVITSLYF